MKINILGTEYEIIETTSDKDSRLSNADGWCSTYEKVILIESNIFPHENAGDIDLCRSERIKVIKRHELIHAFFNECGLDDYSNNEQLVMWIARQFPKILKAFEEVNAI